MKVASALLAISLNFLLGLLAVIGSGLGDTWPAIRFSLIASLTLTLLWLPLYLWLWRSHGIVWLPIFFFPNPFFATIFGLILACVTGGGCS